MSGENKCDYCERHFGSPSRDRLREITGELIPVCGPKMLDQGQSYYDLPFEDMEKLIIKAYERGKEKNE